MDTTNGPQVFISHSQSDTPWARELAKHLGNYGLRVFLAFDSLPGDNVHIKIGNALEAADAMVVLISPAAAQSSYVQQEIQYALGAERFQGRLIPVEVKPTQDYPWVLRSLHWIKTDGDAARAGHQIASILQMAGGPDVHVGAR
ncbi:MAG TPA: toll/interleukin-1 receptor domain-containing protein [Thermoanaerobaculia bacterium]|jgi:hypothetical protein|nr:toll/interleukin-1 receptor domain-containing protein [Thermoanaerobaculia bacterium]